jgi:hypothetical protein
VTYRTASSHLLFSRTADTADFAAQLHSKLYGRLPNWLKRLAIHGFLNDSPIKYIKLK